MVQTRLQEIAAGIAASHGPGCGITVKFLEGYPACVNAKECADNVISAGIKLLGDRLVGYGRLSPPPIVLRGSAVPPGRVACVHCFPGG